MQSLKIVLLELPVADASINFADASTKIINAICYELGDNAYLKLFELENKCSL